MAKQSVKAGGHGKPMAPYKAENEKDVTFAEGGDTPMFGPQKSAEQKPGGTAHDEDGHGGDKFAVGGKGKMFGYTPSVPQKSGITSPR